VLTVRLHVPFRSCTEHVESPRRKVISPVGIQYLCTHCGESWPVLPDREAYLIYKPMSMYVCFVSFLGDT
jgi:hypothetical protein